MTRSYETDRTADRPWTPPVGSGGRSVRGFTLIELLTVITIISILAAFLLVGANNILWISKRKATKSLIEKLDNGLQSYRQTFTTVPRNSVWTDESGVVSPSSDAALLHAAIGTRLRAVTSVDPITGTAREAIRGPFVKNFRKDEVMGGNTEDPQAPFQDAWGNKIHVEFRPGTNPPCGKRDLREFAAIWSEGPPPPKPKNPSSAGDGCDENDINNFGDEFGKDNGS